MDNSRLHYSAGNPLCAPVGPDFLIPGIDADFDVTIDENVYGGVYANSVVLNGEHDQAPNHEFNFRLYRVGPPNPGVRTYGCLYRFAIDDPEADFRHLLPIYPNADVYVARGVTTPGCDTFYG